MRCPNTFAWRRRSPPELQAAAAQEGPSQAPTGAITISPPPPLSPSSLSLSFVLPFAGGHRYRRRRQRHCSPAPLAAEILPSHSLARCRCMQSPRGAGGGQAERATCPRQMERTSLSLSKWTDRGIECNVKQRGRRLAEAEARHDIDRRQLTIQIDITSRWHHHHPRLILSCL